MKIIRLVVEAFRGFGRKQIFELGDVNVLAGPNGFGKTSFFDAVLWGLFGEVPRLSGNRDFVTAGEVLGNKFAAVPHSVELTILVTDGLVELRRTTQRFTCSLQGRKISNEQMLRVLRLDGQEGRQRFLRSNLLQQDTVGEFVRTLNPRKRYDTLLSMLRFPLPDLLVSQLETAISAVSSRQASEMQRSLFVANRTRSLEADITKLETATKGASYEVIEERYRALVRSVPADVRKLLSLVEQGNDSSSIRERTIELERRIVDARRSLQRISIQLDLALRLGSSVERDADSEALEQEIRRIQEASAELGGRWQSGEAEIERRADDLRRLQSQLEAERRILGDKRAVLATIRRFVETNICPVCLRPLEKEQLLSLIDGQIGAAGSALDAKLADLEEKGGQLQVLRQEIVNLKSARDSNSERMSQLMALLADREKFRVVRNELSGDDFARSWGVFSDDLQVFHDRLAARMEQVAALASETEGLLSMFDRLSAAELLPAKLEELSLARREGEELQRVNTELSLVLSSLRSYSAAITQSQISLLSEFVKGQAPLIRALYQRMYPQPLFPEIDLEVTGAYGSGELYLVVSSSQKTKKANPSTIFSASQLNVLAVVIFLALNLRSETSASLLMLDDPIHSMDDLNVLGFCDVVRQLKPTRQLILSTHSRDFYTLLLNKLRPTNSSEVVKGSSGLRIGRNRAPPYTNGPRPSWQTRFR